MISGGTMGLDVSHGCWSGAYSAFSRWRNELAVAAGYKVARHANGHVTATLPWDQFTEANLQGEWDYMPGDDPLIWLLAHSDCDGVIHPEQGELLAGRLEQLLPKLDATETVGHIWPHMRGVTEQFIAGLREAAVAGEDVEFC
jgi:hypothetical protein